MLELFFAKAKSIMPITNFIAEAKRIADQYGVWYAAGDKDRKEKLQKLLSNVHQDKIKQKALRLISYRYHE